MYSDSGDFKRLSEKYKKEMMSMYSDSGNIRASGGAIGNDLLSERIDNNVIIEQGTASSVLPIRPISDIAGEPTDKQLSSAYNENDFSYFGYIRVSVTLAYQTSPIPGATVIVKGKNEAASYSKTLKTDISGNTEIIKVPAPSKASSLEPNGKTPLFYQFDISVKDEDYPEVIIKDVPVFEGILSIQPVVLSPIAERKQL